MMAAVSSVEPLSTTTISALSGAALAMAAATDSKHAPTAWAGFFVAMITESFMATDNSGKRRGREGRNGPFVKHGQGLRLRDSSTRGRLSVRIPKTPPTSVLPFARKEF